MSPADAPRLHEDRDLFAEAVRFTAAQTRFAPRLIEKDYFCTVLLEYLADEATLVFKGGTCLAKVHAGFYRMSEDLDFVVPVALDAPRAERRQRAAPIKTAIELLPERLDGFSIVEPLDGANESRQYLGAVGYQSLLTGEEESIKLEVGLREPLLTPRERGRAQTLLLDPITNQPSLPPIDVTCISKQEAFAEKFRAALTRREPAVRDFFDIDHAIRRLGLQPEADQLLRLVDRKLAVPGTETIDVSPARRAALQRQLDAELRPVLRAQDFEAFDLDRAFETVTGVARRLEAT
jgi:predicted nucleotidyltransferase component of viral defense system